jgi:hypothetical protein
VRIHFQVICGTPFPPHHLDLDELWWQGSLRLCTLHGILVYEPTGWRHSAPVGQLLRDIATIHAANCGQADWLASQQFVRIALLAR